MDVLRIIFYAVLVIFGVAVAGLSLLWLVSWLTGTISFTVTLIRVLTSSIIASFPLIAGLVGGTLLWMAERDNIGVLLAITGIVGQIFWTNYRNRNS